jgi:putative ABC transport system permease protein
MMRRSPLFSAAVIVTIALAIAANTTIFSVVNAVLLRPLPFADADRLVQVAEKNDRLNLPTFSASVPNFVSWREQARSFEEFAAIGFNNYTLTGSGEPEQLSGNRISPAVMRVLGLAPVIGRAFADDEEKPAAAPVAMIGEGLWRRRFGADRAVVGQTIILNDVPATVVGVAPAALNLLSGGDVYTPLTINLANELRLNHLILVVGRVKRGVSLGQAQADMDGVARRVGAQFPEVRDWGIHLVSLFDTFVSAQLKTELLVLWFAVGLVLLIACANVANLLLARAVARSSEMAVRAAMGAQRTRLLRQLLVESVMLSAVGGTIGLMGAVAAVGILNHALPQNTLPVPTVPVDPTVLWFAAGLTIFTGLAFGLAPAWRVSRLDINDVLKQAGRGASAAAGGRLRKVLAAGELALATVLLIGAALLLQSVANLERVHLGFEPRGLLTFQLSPPTARYPLNGGASAMYRDLLDSLRSIPGVTGAAVSSGIPFGVGSYTTHPMLTTGQSVVPHDTLVPIDWRIVSPGYFGAMNIPLLSGRDFTDADNANALPVVVVSQATAKKFWGDLDPLGRTLTRSGDRRVAFTVVGVVGDVRSTALSQESPALYYPVGWRTWPLMDVIVKTSGAPQALLPAVRQKVRERDANFALANVRTLEQWVSASASQPRLSSALLGLFAFFALLTATLGIYGVLAYSVSQRVREIGLRMALGATPGTVIRLIAGEGMRVALTGVVAGIGGGLALGRWLSSLVYGVTIDDPSIFAGVSISLSLIAVVACVVPARRASRVDPMLALRTE